jgi:predicted regulator of Ras-like GTPase activity (Roadblock/LC7/MglB family)
MAGSDTEAALAEEAAGALAYLDEITPQLRGAVILDPEGEPLAATGDADTWAAAAAELLAAADAAGDEPADHAHVATEDGEVFALRHGGLAIVAVTERFVLASLTLFDMRAVLRDLAGEPTAGEAGAGLV